MTTGNGSTGSAGTAREIERLLLGGMRTAAQLTAALQISQPTLSRTIQGMAASVVVFRVSGDRTPRYALLRSLPLGLSARQPVYRFLGNGGIQPFSELTFLAGGATLERSGGKTRVYAGLPPYVAFAAPSGFLGRQRAQEAARSPHFPASLKDWSDEHRVAYLFTRGVNLPGNLVFGDTGLQMEMDFRALEPVPEIQKLPHYLEMATALKTSAYGSSAGGEQPKFLSRTADTGPVIVKFARLGTRMAELLPLEHLALRSLSEVGVPASATALLSAGDWVFLEVKRFDRTAHGGRVGMLSAGAIDDEFFDGRDTWSEFARRCEQHRVLSPQDARHVDVMAAFSELIGNTDRHLENISLLIDDDGEYRGIAPAYDILPMRYAPLGGGVDPELSPIEPKVGSIGARPEVWQLAERAAVRFWEAAEREALVPPTSAGLRRLAATNLAVARRFVAPLLPAAA